MQNSWNTQWKWITPCRSNVDQTNQRASGQLFKAEYLRIEVFVLWSEWGEFLAVCTMYMQIKISWRNPILKSVFNALIYLFLITWLMILRSSKKTQNWFNTTIVWKSGYFLCCHLNFMTIVKIKTVLYDEEVHDCVWLLCIVSTECDKCRYGICT